MDVVYTYVFTKVANSTKIHFIKNQANRKFDGVFLGSSRVVNHINCKVIDSVLGANSINFGITDAQPKDILTILKLLNQYNIESKTVYVQTDYYYNSEDKSRFLYVDLLPFIRENKIIKEYFQDEKDFIFLYYLPFYRFCKADFKLGIRDVLAVLFRKNKFKDTKGFEPMFGSGNTWVRSLPSTINKENKYNKEIEIFVKGAAYKTVFFVAPFRNDTKNLDFIFLLKRQYVDLWDFSNSIKDPSKFTNGYHLNASGANEFSIQLANKIKLYKK